MNESKILTSLEDCKKYFKQVNLSVELGRNMKELTIKKFSYDYISQLFYDKTDYNVLYTIAMEKEDYDFHITIDDGIFQFYTEKVRDRIVAIHYIFYSNPKDVESIKDLIEIKETIGNNKDIYALFDLADDKDNVLYFRYDFDEKYYNGIIHSISHLHIGFNNEIRIPLDKILTPEAFVDFVIKYTYKNIWQNAIKNSRTFKERVENLKEKCESLNAQYFSDEERKMFFIS